MSDPTITGAILAGGHARRFGGRDKLRLPVHDRPGATTSKARSIIVRQVDILQRVAVRVMVVTSRQDRVDRPERFADLNVTVVVDLVPDAGALGGIHAALTASTTGRTVILAGDMPFVTAPLLEALAARADGVDGVWVRSPRGPEPLLACYGQSALPAVEALLHKGERRARALAGVLTIAELGPDELARFGDPDRLTSNVNTPDEYAALQ